MELTAEQAWAKILEAAKAKLPEQTFRTWLAPTRPVAVSADLLVITAPSDFAGEWIEHKYGKLLAGLTREVLGESFTLSIESRGEREASPPDLPSLGPDLEEVKAAAAREGASSTATAAIGRLNPRYTLDRFVVGSNSQLAAAASHAVAEAPGRAYNPLFIYGGVGLGKTHLMHAVGNAVLQGKPKARVAYLPTEQFTNELIAAIQARRTSQFHGRYRQIDVLLLDDAHFLAGKERTQEEFFHTFNALHDAQKQIVLTSDRPPKEIPGLQERLVSRFEWGLVTDIKAPDFETRVAILQAKAEEDGLAIPHDVLALIAQQCRSSVRELEGAIIKLLAYSSLSRREINADLASQLLGGSLRPRPDLAPSEIEAAVAEAFGVQVGELQSKSRERRVTQPRQVAMYLEKTLLDLPYKRIGQRFGGRDHSTVIHSIQRVEQQMAANAGFRERVVALQAQLC